MAFTLKTVWSHAPEDIEHYSTDQMRQEFLMTHMFVPGDIHLNYYPYNDRMILGGVVPTDKPLEIVLDKKLGVQYFLERRELGFINIGGKGKVTIDGHTDEILPHDGYYIGCQTKHVVFESEDSNKPAKFYTVSTPAQKKYPNHKLEYKNAIAMPMGDQAHMNKRVIHKIIDKNLFPTCQLQMGYTVLDPGNSWNTMPCHTHERRTEAYLYTEFYDKDTRVEHIMGKPNATKHIWLEPDEIVMDPSWSVHFGVGTGSYAFIWAMCGENQTYDDMDIIPMHELR